MASERRGPSTRPVDRSSRRAERRAKRPTRAVGGAVLLGLVAALSLSAPAWAQGLPAEPSAADKDQARELMDKGVEREEAKDYASALRAFQAAHTLVGFPMTGLAVARAQAGLGLLLEAYESAVQAKNNPIRPTETPAFEKARADADAFAQALSARIPSIQVMVQGPSSGAEISIDGVAIAASAAMQPRKVNPGKHVVAAMAPGYDEARVEVQVPEGKMTPVTLTMTPAAAGPEGPGGPGGGKSGGLSPLVFVGFGVGAAGLIAGTVTGALSLSKTSSIRDQCSDDGACPASTAKDIQRATTLANVSNISLAVGAAGVAVGVVGIFLSGGSGDKKPAAATTGIRVKPAIGPGSISIIGVF